MLLKTRQVAQMMDHLQIIMIYPVQILQNGHRPLTILILICEATSTNSTMGIELLDTLVEHTDYIFHPKETWNQLCAWLVLAYILFQNLSWCAEILYEIKCS